MFVSLGMFIIDEIHYPDRASVHNVLGGGGLFALLGARIALTFADTKQCSFILDQGSDFPQETMSRLEEWHTGLVVRRSNERLTTRGWNRYSEHDFREFKYLTPKLRIDIEDLVPYGLDKAQAFHFVCSPARLASMAGKLENTAAKTFCWEAVPDLCVPEELEACHAILPQVDVFSPNCEEAARFLGLDEPFEKHEIENLAARYLPYLTKKNSVTGLQSCVVLRCGALGVYVASADGTSAWFPAYHAANPAPNIVDCTGAGNTFCGAFTAALAEYKDVRLAAILGNVAAGVCLEVLGVPRICGEDLNGTSLTQRLLAYGKWCDMAADVARLLQPAETRSQGEVETGNWP